MTKEILLRTVEDLPDSFSMEELMNKLLIAQGIDDGLKSLRENGGTSHQQVMEEMTEYMTQKRNERNNLV